MPVRRLLLFGGLRGLDGDGAEACGASLLAGPIALVVGASALVQARFDAPTRAAVRAELAESIRPFADGFAVPGRFVVASGTRP
ncbi:MAG: hypothetical protein AB7G13_25645 [Lautropia sp.]